MLLSSNCSDTLEFTPSTTVGGTTFNSPKLVINANGNVGINNVSPTDKLHVLGADDGITICSIAANRPVLKFINGSTTMLKLSANGTYGAIADNTGNDIVFFKGGCIGIGTTSPQSKLHIDGTTSIYAGSAGNSPDLIFGSETTSTSSKRIFLSSYWMVMQGHYNEGIRFQAVNGLGSTRTLAEFYGSGVACFCSTICAPIIAATEARFGNSYTCAFPVACVGGTYATVIPPNTLTSLAVYLAHIYYDNGVASPYTANTAFIFKTTNTNGGSTDNAFFPMTSTHQGGTGCWSFRNIAGTGQVSSGLQIQAHSFSCTGGNATLYLSRLA